MQPTPYDAFPYMSQAYVETHVDRLFTVGHLFAVDPVPVERARVLEIGCADGANLVPMAEGLPDASFVGIDLSTVQVEEGRRRIEPLGLTNLELIAGSFVDLDEKHGLFDYVIVHGVLSWIPPELRATLLERIRQRLSPRGIAYLSYNTNPGFQRRAGLRDFLRLHLDGVEGDAARVEQARQMLKWLFEASSPETDEGRLRRRNCELMMAAPAPYLIHGLLAEHNHPLYLNEFLAEAGTAGLRYLGDSNFGSMLPERLYKEARLGMESAPGGLEEHEQIHDFLVDRAFRRSLVMHADVKPVRSIPWERAESLWISGRPRRIFGRIEDSEEARFDTNGVIFSTDDPVLKWGLQVLADAWPGNLRFVDWVSMTAMRSKCGGVVTRSTLGRNLLGLYGREIVQLGPRDLGATDRVTERPCTTRWARRRVELGLPATDLRHEMRSLPRIPRLLVPLLDGAHDHAALLRAVRDAHRLGRLKLDSPPEMALRTALDGLLQRSMLTG